MRPFFAAPRTTERDLREAASLRVVGHAAFVPLGAGYDPRALGRHRVRTLRGGEDGLVVRFGARAGEILVDVLTNGQVSAADVEAAIATARAMAAIDDDPTPFLRIARRDPRLKAMTDRADPRLGRTPTVFESFAVTVLEQLVTGEESRAAIRRLWALAGETIPGTGLRAAPTAAAVHRVPMWKLRAIGVGATRAATLHTGAGRGAALERLRDEAPEAFMAKLQSLRGVGPWTANQVARQALGWADAVPIGDFHAPGFVTRALTGEEGGDAEMLAALEPFRPHRARVVILLERAFVRGIGIGGSRKWRPPRVDPHRREPWKY